MLKLDDFFHLPQLDTCIEQMMSDEHGAVVVAGLDPRPIAGTSADGDLVSSGRATIFRVLASAMMASAPQAHAVVVAEDLQAVRFTHQFGRRVRQLRVQPSHTYANRIAEAVRQQPDLLVIDHLTSESATSAFAAAHEGLRMISQLDTVFRGADVVQQVRDLGAASEHLVSLRWVIAVQRCATLCSHCRQPLPPDPELLERLQDVIGTVLTDEQHDGSQEWSPTFFQSLGCDKCHFTGRLGDVAVFDIFHKSSDGDRAALPLTTYMLRLAALGYLPVDDVLSYQDDQLQRTYRLLTASEEALASANGTLQSKLVELESANQVLEQRTAALRSLQDMSQALISCADLDDLVARVCRSACELCGADRAILYLHRSDDVAEVLAVIGWDKSLLHRQLEAGDMFSCDTGSKPIPFSEYPPGIPTQHADVAGFELRAGLRVPLLAEDDCLGLMVIHTTQKARFTHGEVALLQTFANQAALSIERATLIERLRDNLAELEAAQAAIVQQERLERELELAHEVQQSVLPRVFPAVPGYRFAACNQPARQVGGDLYDIFALDDERFGLVIGDVSDKGMPAALYMGLTRALLLAEARREPSPRAVLLNVNRLLRELGEPGMFVTVFYGVVESATGRLTFARAGHDYPLLFRDGIAQRLGGTGVVLGFFDTDELDLSEEQLDLQTGDTLALYTDGLTDVLNADSQRFDLDQLTGVLGAHIDLEPEAIGIATFADLAAYQGSAAQFDDMTLLVMKVMGEKF